MRPWTPLLLAVSASQKVRPLHWVIRSSSLQRTLDFTQNVLGMQVLRHEENEEACPITCNGNFSTSWSKTMVGYGPEDEHFALELTYNYGVASYSLGEGLQRFVVEVPNPHLALAWAERLGYKAELMQKGESEIVGPDGYRFEIRGASTQSAFHSVVLRSVNPELVAAWYEEMLGFTRTESNETGLALRVRNQSFQYIFERADSPPRLTEWDGRNAVALPESHVRGVYEWLRQESPMSIVHDLRELPDKLGTLLIAIVKDPGGFELCLVSAETFDPSLQLAMS
ncbi:unnamed protein product [Effrenium voratum]|nr:unnamed protein product [Effrenium voratum]CAJ1351767.1 unnamed protein product [Effrenium voratum]